MTALDGLAVVPFHDADSPQRARMLSRLADTVLSVALKAEAKGDRIELRIFPLEGGPVALACDTEDRLAGFFGGPVEYAAMPGRVLAGILRNEEVGLLVNPGHPSEMLLDASILDWLASALSASPEAAEARLRLTAPSSEIIEILAEPLAARLIDMSELIDGVALAGVRGGDDGCAKHVLLITGAAPEYQPAIAKALAETLAFLPPQPGGVDVSFSDSPPPATALRFEFEQREPVSAKQSPRPPFLR